MLYLTLTWRLTRWFSVADISQALSGKNKLHILLAYLNLVCGEKKICALHKPSSGRMQIV